MAIIYTIGRASVYEDYIATDPTAAKRKGGSVWLTLGEAEIAAKEETAALGLILCLWSDC